MGEARARFVEALALDLSVVRASRAAGIGRATAYEWRAADPDFAVAWDIAVEDALDELEASTFRRACGYERPIFQRGEMVDHEPQHDALAAEMILRARRF